jgi:predicted ATPase
MLADGIDRRLLDQVGLEVALLRVEATGLAFEQRAISLAGLGVLRAISRRTPLLVALDDLQWLDGSSARVLGFVVRRLRDEPIGVLASVRLGTDPELASLFGPKYDTGPFDP